MINASEFIDDIEELRKTLSLTYMEAVVYWCEARSLDVESVSYIIKKNRVLKSRLRSEAENLNYLKKKASAKLPV